MVTQTKMETDRRHDARGKKKVGAPTLKAATNKCDFLITQQHQAKWLFHSLMNIRAGPQAVAPCVVPTGVHGGTAESSADASATFPRARPVSFLLRTYRPIGSSEITIAAPGAFRLPQHLRAPCVTL